VCKKILYGILVGAGAAAAALALWAGGALNGAENLTWNMRVRFFARREKPSDKVKVVLIDQASLDWGKNENAWPWPWPRVVYGPILDFCKRSGARAVLFDMLFTEPSMHGVADDEELGSAIRRSPPFVGAVVLGRQAGLTTRWPAEMPAPELEMVGLSDWLTRVNHEALVAPTALFPVPEVGTNMTLLSNVMDVPDEDGVFRRSVMFRVFDGQTVPSLGFAGWLAGLPEPERVAPARIEPGWIRFGDRHIPIDREGRAILRYRGSRGYHESYSAAAVIQSELRLQAGESPAIADLSVFKDCYVLVGPSAPALLDLRTTPLSDVAPGVEVHATLLDNLLTDAFLRDVPRPAVVGAVCALALFCALVVTWCRKPWQNVLALTVLLPVPLLAGFAAYAGGWWLPVVVGEVGAALAMVGAMVVNYATEGRQKAFIKQAFKFYLSPGVIEQILVNPAQLRLGGEKRPLTLFFSDIEKFSSFSERLDPPTLTGLLNDFMSDMTDIILEEGGTLDKYIGDAIVAFWNAPLAQEDHAVRALRAAIRCQQKLAERRPEFLERTGALIKMRIGLNSGDVVVGNMGSRQRFNYTVLGDAANLASRLEGANKAFGSYVMASEATWALSGRTFVGRELGLVRVVGRQAPVRVFEPSALPGEACPALYPDFEKALALCRRGEWSGARELFGRWPDDPASRIYDEKCRDLASRADASWDGVWNLSEK